MIALRASFADRSSMSILNSIQRKNARPESSPIGYARFFHFTRFSRFPAIRADLLEEAAVPNAMTVPGCARGPIFLAAKPGQRGTTWLKPVAKGRHLVIPYPRWPKKRFLSRASAS
jgi:hypothetical protein